MLEDEFFDSLRTKDQLGYYVSASQRNSRGIPGLLFIVESSKYQPEFIQQKIYAFIQNYFDNVLSEELYDKFLKGLINKKQEPFRDI